MSVRRLVVEVDPKSLNVTEFCAQHGISTWFFWDLRRRHRLGGDAALEVKSRAPRTIANKTSPEVEDEVIAKRKELLDAGLDAGSESIAWHLRDRPGVPSPSTIWRILKARGFITPEPKKAPKRTLQRFTAARANECWQLDDTGWALAEGTEVKILNVVDDHSRLLVASTAGTACTGEHALRTVAQAAAIVGWPARFQSDNAGPFRYVLADALRPLGIDAGHSRPYHPQTNGKVERFHQTLKRWLNRQPSAATVAELQIQLDAFRHLYNHCRPHRSLGRRFPAEAWTDAPKAGPADRALGAPTTTHASTIDTGGRASVGSRYMISVGSRYAGRSALTVITGTACHVFVDGQLARALTLDPTRRVQPLHTGPGRPRLP